jgi:hypothetical protein
MDAFRMAYTASGVDASGLALFQAMEGWLSHIFDKARPDYKGASALR